VFKQVPANIDFFALARLGSLKPIYDLIKKGTKFKRENKHEDATHGLKQALTKAPVLSCPDFAEIFVLQADASDCGFGAFLTPESADEE